MLFGKLMKANVLCAIFNQKMFSLIVFDCQQFLKKNEIKRTLHFNQCQTEMPFVWKTKIAIYSLLFDYQVPTFDTQHLFIFTLKEKLLNSKLFSFSPNK